MWDFLQYKIEFNFDFDFVYNDCKFFYPIIVLIF